MIQTQQTMILSEYLALYDLIIPKDNILRKINELVDFNFIFEELKDKYCIDNGRKAVNPIRLFKYILLKAIYDLSDVDVVERSKYDMSFKYFLDMAPEDSVIDASLLTKFRKLRLKDAKLLDLLIGKTVQIAIEKGIIKSRSLIVDSTHTKARYNQKTPREILLDYSKNLRKAVYKVDENFKSKMPAKINNGVLEDEIRYSKNLISLIKSDGILSGYPSIKEKMNILEEVIEDSIQKISLSKDEDAKVGHKTYDTSFFGYKTHIAMTPERIITSAIITSGEKHDGKQLKGLVEKSIFAGVEVENIIGDAAYSEKGNIEYSKDNNINLIAKLSKLITHGIRAKENEFEYNKDANMYVCPQGHMAIRKYRHVNKKCGASQTETYIFDINECIICPQKEGCYKQGSKSKTYSVSIKDDLRTDHMEFEQSEFFKEMAKQRYKIEAKNSELKHRHGYDVSSSSGLFGMQLQGAVTIFAVNMKRIIKLLG